MHIKIELGEYLGEQGRVGRVTNSRELVWFWKVSPKNDETRERVRTKWK